MSNFIVDASLLACPAPDAFSPKEFRPLFVGFLSRLTELAKLRLACKSIRFWSDDQLASVLVANNCYPFFYVLRKAFQHLPDQHEFQIEDINVLATALIEKSRKLEEAGNVRDLVVSDCLLEGDPVANRIEAFRDYLCRVLALALPVLGDNIEFAANTYLATGGDNPKTARVVATYTVLLIERQDGSCTDSSKQYRVQIASYSGAIALFREADLAAWWTSCTEEACVEVCAIRAASDHLQSWETFELVRGKLSLGPEFISSANSCGFMHDRPKIDKLLRVCADLALGRDAGSGHALRTGQGANDPQMTRGKWHAWRHDIDYEFHLHYWKLGSRIELANVVVHNDFGISS